MKKIVLDETQADKLMNKLVSEQITDNNRYAQEVKCSFDYHNLTYMGHEIDWIEDITFSVSFSIYMDGKGYGIKDINITNVRGPEAVDVAVIYFPGERGGDEEPIEDEIVLKLNWDEVKVDNDATIGWIGIDQDVEVELMSTDDGSLIAGGITVHSKEI